MLQNMFVRPPARKTLKQALRDRARADRCSVPEIVDRALVAYLFPSHRVAAQMVEMLYDGDTLAEAYERTFCYLAIDRIAKTHDNGMPLIATFANLVAQCSYRFTGNECEMKHLIQQLKYIGERSQDADIWHDRDLCRYLIHQLRNDPTIVSAQEIVNFVQTNYYVIRNNALIYRILMDVACMAGQALPDTPALRKAYIDKLAEISAGW